MAGIASILGSIPWFAWIAIVAIVSSCVSQIVYCKFKHAERMELIRQGINPDARPGIEKAYSESEL